MLLSVRKLFGTNDKESPIKVHNLWAVAAWSLNAPHFPGVRLAMAATSTPASIACCSWREQLPCASCSRIRENLPSRQRIRVASGRGQARASLASGFLGQLELRRTLARRGLGKHGVPSRQLRRKVGVARAGLPVVSSIPVLGPVVNAVLNPVVLFILYAAGASRFWSGFQKTTYSNSAPTKVALVALWPALFIASAAFRSNFKKAVN